MSDNIVNMQDWIDDNMLLYDITIEGDEYLMLTIQNALEARNMKSTRGAIVEFQELYNLLDPESNNAGVIDIKTFLKLIEIFDDYTRIPIIKYYNKKVTQIYSGLQTEEKPKETFINKVKNFFHNLFINDK